MNSRVFIKDTDVALNKIIVAAVIAWVVDTDWPLTWKTYRCHGLSLPAGLA